MDLTAVLMRAAALRPRVLLVSTPSGTPVRLAAEKELRLRDWPSASTPAGADLMLIAGPDCPWLRPALDRLWQDMPRPRVRVRAATADNVASVLEAGRVRLGTPGGDRAETDDGAGPNGHGGPGHIGGAGAGNGEAVSADRKEDGWGPGGGEHAWHQEEGSEGSGHGGEHDSHDGTADGGSDEDTRHRCSPEAAGHGYGADASPGGHEGHGGSPGGHGHGDMEMPGGLALAEQGEDRDGLMLDRLHVALGPLLADWPAGLTIRVSLQGDVIQQADFHDPIMERSFDSSTGPFWCRPWVRATAGEAVSVGEAARRRAAAHLDSLGRLLAVAGWPAEAATARRLRDDLLEQAPAAAVLPPVLRFARRVGRSRTLYWLTRGIGPLSVEDARAVGASGPAVRAGGDVPARYRQWLTDVVADMRLLDDTALLDPVAQESPRGRWEAGRPPSAALTELLPPLLEGTELGAARLIVASLDPDPDELALDLAEAVRG